MRYEFEKAENGYIIYVGEQKFVYETLAGFLQKIQELVTLE